MFCEYFDSGSGLRAFGLISEISWFRKGIYPTWGSEGRQKSSFQSLQHTHRNAWRGSFIGIGIGTGYRAIYGGFITGCMDWNDGTQKEGNLFFLVCILDSSPARLHFGLMTVLRQAASFVFEGKRKRDYR